MKAILVNCPHCNARLKIAEASDTITCEYCGTASRIQRRTRMLERVIPPPMAMPGRPLPIAVQRRSPLLLVIVLASVLLPIIITTVVIAMVARSVGDAVQQASTTSSTASAKRDEPEWQGTGRVILTDLDGDGTLDLIGRSRRLGNTDEVRAIAIDGKTGKPRWESEALGKYSNTQDGFLALVGDLVLFTTPRAEIKAFTITEGKLRWTAKLSERVARFCDRGESIVAVGADDVERPLQRGNGAAAAAEVDQAPRPVEAVVPKRGRKVVRPKAGCAAVPTDERTRRFRDVDYELGRRHAVQVDADVTGPAGRVLSGTREKGTRVATLVALDEAGNARWRTEVPTDPLGARAQPAEHVVVTDREVCGTYHADSSSKPPVLACFAMADGKRLWEGRIDDSPLSAVEVAGRAVVISTWGMLEARELDSGTTRWRYGR